VSQAPVENREHALRRQRRSGNLTVPQNLSRPSECSAVNYEEVLIWTETLLIALAQYFRHGVLFPQVMITLK
jgi:hypothetical protein